MQTSSTNAAKVALASMRPGPPQAGSQPPAGRPATSHIGRPAPESVSRSEAGISVDLSAASNTAANGEDPMETIQQHGNVGRGVELKAAADPRSKSVEAEKWFQDSNRNASTRGNVSFVNDDPPFHLPTHLPNDYPVHNLPMRTNTHLPVPSLQHMQSLQSSGSEEFRSVIDDLTVENRRLKNENRQLKRQNTTHTHPDQLFEVRMRGLDSKEKKRLMQMLRDFNESLSKTRGHLVQPVAKKASKGSNKPSSSSTLHSNSNPVDSAYASGSTSGNASGSQNAESRTAVANEGTPHNRRKEKDQNVRSYLMNMSRALLPRQTAAMTERARRKLVVKKLEQLYTGKPSTSKRNSQSQQQQQVSTEAANENRLQTEAIGRTVPAEGSREAIMYPTDSDVTIFQRENSATFATNANPSPSRTDSNNNHIDQRPTRPLDLDITRAQNPVENVAYIRHLGFKSEAAAAIPGAKGAWVPLNLLMNLAQLHTINVTPDQVRQALKDLSARFELSSDGSMIRWMGGTERTRLSGESGSSTGSKENSPTDGSNDVVGERGQSPSRSRSDKPSASDQTTAAVKSSGDTGPSGTKNSSRDVSASTGLTSSANRSSDKRPVFLGSISRDDSFSYQPIFLHGAGSEEEGDYFLDEDDSLLSSAMREDTTGSGSGQRSKRLAQPAKEDGAIIFYHRARFCTDLSGDHDIVPVNTTQYARAVCNAVGAPASPGLNSDELKAFINADESIRRAVAMDVEDGPQVEFIETPKLRGAGPGLILKDPFPLLVSGIGSTLISDNFALWPKYEQLSKRATPPVKLVNKFIRARLFGQDMTKWISNADANQVILRGIGCVRRDLPPSEFPSPGFLNQWSSSESADGWSDSEGDEDESKLENAAFDDLPDALPTMANTAFHSHSGSGGASGDDEAEAGEEEDDSDDEIDMLAYERQQNAEETARREREWEEQAIQAEGEDSEEGKRSSAATVGDRSFLSDEDLSPGHGAAGVVAGQKRERDEQVPESSPAKRLESSRHRHAKK